MSKTRYFLHILSGAARKVTGAAISHLPATLTVIFAAAALYLLLKKPPRIRLCLSGILFYAYLVICLTILSREQQNTVRINPLPFWKIRHILLTSRNTVEYGTEIVNNLLLLLPAGMLAGGLEAGQGRRKIVRGGWVVAFGAAAFSAGIEYIQYSCQLGLAEFDDLIHNTIGAMIGYLIVVLICHMFAKKHG